MGAARPPGSSPKTHGKFAVSGLEIGDAAEFIALQDLFASDHLALTRDVYQNVSLRDWQLSLLCPAHVLDEPGGREHHVSCMVRHSEECFQSLTILKATCCTSENEKPTMVGYIMFQVHSPTPAKRRKGGPHNKGQKVGPWTQVKQIFVRQAHRQNGCGKLLLDSMHGALRPEEQEDVRLAVVDLNVDAVRWYRGNGFLVVNLSRELLGERDDANVIIYQEMRRLLGTRQHEALAVPLLFRTEVTREVINIDYPDGSGSYEVKVVGYDEKERWHYVDSRGHSRWEGETFTDIINLNEYFRDGYVRFKRCLSLVHRDIELSKREVRRAKAEASAKESLKRELSSQADERDGGRSLRRGRPRRATQEIRNTAAQGSEALLPVNGKALRLR